VSLRVLGRAMAVTAAVVAAGAALSSAGSRADAPHISRRLHVKGLDLRYARAGQGDPVMLIHGYGESLVSWQTVFDLLARNHDVIAIDLPGFGLSSKPSAGYQTDSLAMIVIGALDELGLSRVSLAGHSLGGAVAAAVAALAPGRVRSLVLVDAAVLVGPWMVPDTAARGTPVEVVRAAIARYQLLRSRFTSPHAPRWLEERPADLDYLPAEDSAAAAALEAVLREFDFAWLTRERAALVHSPTLVLWGQFDAVVPVGEGRLLAELLNAELRIIPRAWHRPHVERPTLTAAEIADFLGSH